MGDLYPADLRETIDAVNADVYDNVNNGVYKAGFATEQDVYERHVEALFEPQAGVHSALRRRSP